MTHFDMAHPGEFDERPEYEVEVDPEFPPDGSWGCDAYAFDRDGRVTSEFAARWGAPTIARVTPAKGPEWVGLYSHGGLGSLKGVFTTPSPGLLCVVAGGLAYLTWVDRPGEGAIVAHDIAHQVVASPEHRLLILASPFDLVAVDSEGIAWRSSQLALDDLRITRLRSEGIECIGQAASHGSARYVVDPETGNPVPVNGGRERIFE